MKDITNIEDKRIVENKATLNRMFINGKNSCFIILKDHRANILNRQKTLLLNSVQKEPVK